MASLPKKVKSSSPDGDMEIFARFHSEFTDIDILKRSFNRLVSDPHNGLVALEIDQASSCNASEGFSFADVFCTLAPHEQPKRSIFAFGVFFIRGLTILREFIKYRVIPERKSEKIALSCLLNYLLDEDQKWKLRSGATIDDTSLAVKLSCHYFTNLTPTKSITLDNTTVNKRSTCTCCEKEVKYGDTSIGNGQVWHGSVDLILDGSEVTIKNLERNMLTAGSKLVSDADEDAHEKRRKQRKCLMQFAAQTIVFSFLQKTRHPEFENFLIPSICVSSNDILFYFYDSEKDMLLGSRKFSMAPHPVLITTLATWLVVNYKVLGNGLTEDLGEVPTANFFAMAKEKLEVYQQKLSLGGVGRDPIVHKQLDPLFLVDDLGSDEFIGVDQVNSLLM